MAKKIELFWMGDGVITINGEDFGANVPLPTAEINDADLEKMKEDGRIGAKIAVIDVTDKALTVLQDKVAKLESEIVELNKQLDEATKPAKVKKDK